MNIEKFKEALFKKLIAKKEFVEEDREKFNSDFNEFDDTWDIMLEIINEEISTMRSAEEKIKVTEKARAKNLEKEHKRKKKKK